MLKNILVNGIQRRYWIGRKFCNIFIGINLLYSSEERFASLLKSVTHQINAMAVLNNNVNFCDSHSGIVTNVAA